jgi:DNA invertase Pin-like site-specific DNA recombinase
MPTANPKSRTARKRLAATVTALAKRAAAYGRLSLLTDESTSPERQRGGTERYIGAMGWGYDPDADFYGDFDSISGSKANVFRPAFNRLMANLDRYDVIVVWKLDRFTRRLVELVEVLDVLREHGVALIAIEDGIDTSKGAHAQLLASIIGAVAQMEAENTGDRVAAAQEYMTRNGRYRGGQVPYGFREEPSCIPGGHIFRQEPNEVRWLTEIIERINDDRSYRSIAMYLSEQGVEAPRARSMREGWLKRKAEAEAEGKAFDRAEPDVSGFRWNVPAVKYIVQNPIIMGHGRYGEDLIRDEEGNPIEIAPPIVSEADYQRLVAKIEGRGQGGAGIARGDHQSLLSGIATCGSCGGKLMKSGRSYVCRAGSAPADVRTCEGVAISQDALDTFVLEWIANELSDERLNAAAEAIVEDEAPEDPTLAEREAVGRRIARMREDRDLGLYDGPNQKADYQRRMREALAELEELQPAPAVHDDLAEILGERVTFEGLLNAELPHLRRFLRAALDVLKIMKGVAGGRQPIELRVQIELVSALATPERAPAR